MKMKDTIEINGTAYVRADAVKQPAEGLDGLPYVLIRSRDSGAHAGYLKEKRGDEVELINARRLWYWDGAATLSQLAIDGVSKPQKCKFPDAVNITVLGVCEIIEATKKAQASIQEVSIWTA